MKTGVGMFVGKFELNPQKETDLGVVQAFFFTPKRDHVKTQTIYYIFFISFGVQR